MEEEAKIEIDGYTFLRYGPENWKHDGHYWEVQVFKKEQLVALKHVIIEHEPLFGYDAEDLARLDRTCEAVLKELKEDA